LNRCSKRQPTILLEASVADAEGALAREVEVEAAVEVAKAYHHSSGLSHVFGDRLNIRQKSAPCRTTVAFGGIGRGGIIFCPCIFTSAFDDDGMISSSCQCNLLEDKYSHFAGSYKRKSNKHQQDSAAARRQPLSHELQIGCIRCT
jgi:hypothetical protein